MFLFHQLKLKGLGSPCICSMQTASSLRSLMPTGVEKYSVYHTYFIEAPLFPFLLFSFSCFLLPFHLSVTLTYIVFKISRVRFLLEKSFSCLTSIRKPMKYSASSLKYSFSKQALDLESRTS